MGKSAGKWIKTVLFGKKHSKSNYSKNGTPDKKGALKSPVEDPARDSSFIPDQLTERGVEKLELEKGTSASQCDAVGVAYVDQGIDSPKNDELAPVSDEEVKRQEQAATKTQAVFRGYLARRAFRALKGIIRLQALIRGHLVRRQAVATLRSMRAIVKFQALARGRSIRLSDDIPVGLADFLEPAAASHRHHEPRSVSAALIRELLPVVKFSDLAAAPESCAVCLYEFDDEDEIRRLVNCRHIFHRSCLDRWMDHDQKTCPLCRTQFVPEEMQAAFNEKLWLASGISDLYAEYLPISSGS